MKAMLLKLLLLAALGAAAASLPAAAYSPPPRDPVSVEIVADDGRIFARYDLHEHSRRGASRAYVEAIRGRNYGIRVRNNTGGRIGLVIAVDGRNILTGEKSHLRANEPMYVLDAGGEATYEGWRTSDTRVHRFFFTEAADSYAEAWGDRSAMGVIAVAAFREVPPPTPRRKLERRSAAPAEPAAGKSAESADAASAPGTGFGDGRYSRSVRVHFVPERHAFTRQFLKYEWRDTLVRLGVIREASPENRFWPEYLGRSQGFAPHPPGYWNNRR